MSLHELFAISSDISYYDVTTASLVLAMSHITKINRAIAIAFAFAFAFATTNDKIRGLRQIYIAPIFPIGNTDCFHSKKALLHT